ncbi:MAG TPA: hypothetical protein VG734_25915 [Lacunisphaera sp.]|nr:hypothetical protein [Lacunisphaera sp.]
MADAHIEIIIGARADRSIQTILGGLPAQAQKARAAMDRALNTPGSNRGGSSGADPELRAFKERQRAIDQQVRSQVALARQRASEEAKAEAQRIANERRVAAEQVKTANAAAAAQKRASAEQAKAAAAEIANQKRIGIEKANAEKQVTKAARESQDAENRARRDRQSAIDRQVRSQTALARQRRQEEARQLRESKSIEDSFAYRTAYHGIIRYAPGALRQGARVANDIIRGAGVDLNVGSSVSRSVSLEQEAVKLSNSAFMEGSAGPAGTRANPRQLAEEVRAAAIANRLPSESTMGGMREFVGRTGDLATARASLGPLMKLAKATGTDPSQMMTFAGTTAATWWKDLAKSPEEAAQRAQSLVQMMNVGAASGKLGTVEFEHLAKYGPKLSAAAQAFTGDKTKNVTEMLALAQMGLMGGAASPAQATTSVAAMVNTMRTPARMKAFARSFASAEQNDPLFRKTFGPGFSQEAGKGKFTTASDFILASIMAAGTNTAKFKSEWANVQGARAVEGLRQRYLEAGGGEAGIAAVRGEFGKYGKSLTDKEVNDSFAAAMDTNASKAIEFQENLDKVVSEMASNVLPQLQKMAPDALKIASMLGKAATWASENPGRAITLAIVGSIARAGLESAGRLALEKVLARGAAAVRGTSALEGGAPLLLGPGGSGGTGGGRLARVARGAGKVFGAATLGYVGYQLGQTAGDLTGDKTVGNTAGTVLAGAGMGAMLLGGLKLGTMTGGPLGAAVGAGLAGWGASHQMIQKDLGGYGGFLAGMKTLFTDGSFFKGLNDRENQKARAAAELRGTGSAPTAVPAAPMAVKADFDPAQLTAAYRAALPPVQRIQGTVKVENLPGTPGDAPDHGDAGRGKRL